MSGVALIFAVGFLNLLLGYAMAVRLGYRSASLEEARPVVAVDEPCDERIEKLDESNETALDESDETALDDLIQELISGPDGPPGSAWDEEPDDPLPESSAGEPIGEAEPAFGADEDSAAGRLLAMVRRTEEHLAWLVDLDTRLRRSAGEYEIFTLLAWADELREGCQRQQAEQATEAFGPRFDALGDLGAAGQDLEAAAAEHSTRLDEAAAHPDQENVKGDLAVAAAQLLEEIDRVENAAHLLRDCLVEAFLVVARSEGRQTAIEESLRFDPLTKFPNRIGLETILQEWNQAGGHEARPLCAALFDLDNFAELNQTHGLQACDGIVRATAECIGGLVTENETLARCGGKRLVVLMFNIDASAAAGRAELVRRSIEATCFSGNESKIRVTLSGGVAAAQPRETPENLLGRLSDALCAAKQSGRNSLFAHDGSRADLIEPADIEVEPREVFV